MDSKSYAKFSKSDDPKFNFVNFDRSAVINFIINLWSIYSLECYNNITNYVKI